MGLIVTGPCFARVRRFRRQVFLVRLFPNSFNNSSLSFTLTSLDPRSNLQAQPSKRQPFAHAALSLSLALMALSHTSGSAKPLRSTFYPCQPTRSHPQLTAEDFNSPLIYLCLVPLLVRS